MPPTKRNRTKRKLRSKRPNSRKLGQTNTIVGASLAPSRILSLLPETFRAQHKYVDQLTFTSGVALVGATFQYGLNCMYDPYIPAGGHQPYGFDQLAAMYSSYVVTSCHVQVTFSPPSTNDCFLAVGWGPSGQPFDPVGYSFTGANNIGEKDNSRWALLPTAAASVKDYSLDLGTFNIANVESKKQLAILTDINYQGGVANNPPAFPTIDRKSVV